MPPAGVELIRLYVVRVMPSERALGPRSTSDKFLRNFPSDFVLHGKNLGEIAVVLLPPQFFTIGRIDKVNVQAQLVGAHPDPAEQQRSNVETPADCLGIGFMVLVA